MTICSKSQHIHKHQAIHNHNIDFLFIFVENTHKLFKQALHFASFSINIQSFLTNARKQIYHLSV